MSKFIIYTFTRSFADINIPLPIQNVYLRNYCLNNNIEFSLPVPEFSTKDNFSKFKEIIKMQIKDKKVLCTSLMIFLNIPNDIKDELKNTDKFLIIGALENDHIWSNKLEEYIENIKDYSLLSING